MTSIFVVQPVRWDRCPVAAAHPLCRSWLTFQSHRGLARNTLDAYSQGLEVFLRFLSHPASVRPSRHAGPHRRVSSQPCRATTVICRTLRFNSGSPCSGCSTPTWSKKESARRIPQRHNGARAIVPRYRKLPWVPNEDDWQTILAAAVQEPIRNRVMLTFAYDAGLRREELCSLCTNDIDPSRRTIWVRAENTKGRRDRIVPYSAASGELLAGYLYHRRTFAQKRGPLFLSESRRNYSAPISIWSWSKIVLRIARRAGVPRFTTHTLRHLCLTDLARAGWDIHEIATFAGHRSVQTTLLYIHLSGRDLARKLAAGMAQIHAQRTRMLAETTA